MRHLCREGASKIWSNYDDKNTRLYPIKNSPRKFKKKEWNSSMYVLLPNMQKKKFKSTYWTMDYRNGKEKQKNKIGFRWLRFFFLLSWWGWSSRQPHLFAQSYRHCLLRYAIIINESTNPYGSKSAHPHIFYFNYIHFMKSTVRTSIPFLNQILI